MKKRVGMLVVLALMGMGSALAQTQTTPTTTPSMASDQTRFVALAGRIQGMGKLLEAEGKVSKEQAQQLLLYFRAIRATAAMTPIMADWYVRNLDERFTAEQRNEIGTESAMTPADNTTQPTDTNASQPSGTATDTNTQPVGTDAAGASNPPTGDSGSGGSTQPSDTTTQPAAPSTTDTSSATQPTTPSTTDTSNATQPAAPSTTDTSGATQPAAPSTTETQAAPSMVELNIEAANPFNQDPIVATLDQLIEKLTALARS